MGLEEGAEASANGETLVMLNEMEKHEEMCRHSV